MLDQPPIHRGPSGCAGQGDDERAMPSEGQAAENHFQRCASGWVSDEPAPSRYDARSAAPERATPIAARPGRPSSSIRAERPGREYLESPSHGDDLARGLGSLDDCGSAGWRAASWMTLGLSMDERHGPPLECRG